MLTPTEALLEVAKSNPNLVAIRYPSGDDWTYGQLWARVRRLADKLEDSASIGQHVGLYME